MVEKIVKGIVEKYLLFRKNPNSRKNKTKLTPQKINLRRKSAQDLLY